MRRFCFVLYIVVGFNTESFGQDFSNLWTGYFSYSEIVDVTDGDDKIYAASENAVFSYDVSTSEIDKITTIEGLSGELISTITYSSAFQILLIGYETGLIDVYFEEDQQVLSVVDIVEKATIAPDLKRINDFNLYEGLVYIATDFGISVYDLERLEFGDTYFIGTGGSQIRVLKTSIFNDAIYAACQNNNGIKKGLLSNPNLIDSQQWQTLGLGSNFVSVEAIDQNLYAVRSDRTFFELVNDNLVPLSVFNQLPNDSDVVSEQLIYTTNDNTFIYNSDATLALQISQTQEFDTNFTSAIQFENDIYIGTKDFGILKTSLGSTTEFEVIKPQGPLFNSAFKIEAGNNELWMTYGEYSQSFNPQAADRRGVSHLKGEEWVNIPYDSLLGASDLNYISLNPFNTDQVFISSFRDGLLEINNDEPTILYNQTNSDLESLFDPNAPNAISIRVSGSQFDRTGKLWTVTSRVDRALKSYDPSTNRWQSFSFGDLILDPLLDELGFSDLVIDDNGTKWIGSFFSGLIGYNENSGESVVINNINTEEQNLPIPTVRAVEVDGRNQVWIGTEVGLRVLFNTSSFFSESEPSVNNIVILEDGIPKELLEGVYITDIKADGSNNKWVGTLNSGIFYFSPDGQETIYQFTKANSPLPSNSINDIGIDRSNGTVYIATSRGLVAFSAGGSEPGETLDDVFAYPNPVRPEYNILGSNDLNDITKGVKISGLTENVNVKITDIEGNLVAEAQSRVNLRSSSANYNFAIDGGTGIWNGKNLANNVVATGVYLIMISDLDSFETKVIKLLIVR